MALSSAAGESVWMRVWVLVRVRVWVANVITAQCNLVSERGGQETRCMPREHEQHGS